MVIMKKQWFILSFFTAVFSLLSCAAQSTDTYKPEVAKAFSEAGLPLLQKKVSPRDFSLPLVSPAPMAAAGGTQSLSSLKGKVVFLNFWATWCGPCRAEMPSMETLYNRYKGKGLEILAVNCAEEQPEVLAFLRKNKLSFPSVLDGDGKIAQEYGIRGIPTTFLLDRDGMVIARIVGSLNWEEPKINTALEMLLNSGS